MFLLQVILLSLMDITCETLPEGETIGFKLDFTFAENEFFTNKVLTKTYIMADTGDDPVLEKAEGTPIDWAPGKNVTVKVIKKKQRVCCESLGFTLAFVYLHTRYCSDVGVGCPEQKGGRHPHGDEGGAL